MQRAVAGVARFTRLYGMAVASLSLKMATCLFSETVGTITSTYRELGSGKSQLLRNVLVNLMQSVSAPAWMRNLKLEGAGRHLTKTRLFTLGVVFAVLRAVYAQRENPSDEIWRITATDLFAQMCPILLGEPGAKSLAACVEEACSSEPNMLSESLFQMIAEEKYIKLRQYMQCFPNEVCVQRVGGALVLHKSSLESVFIAASALVSAMNCMIDNSWIASKSWPVFQKLWLQPVTESGYLASMAKGRVPVWPAGLSFPFIQVGRGVYTEATPVTSPSLLDDSDDADCTTFGMYAWVRVNCETRTWLWLLLCLCCSRVCCRSDWQR